ncbi:zinc finger BED domain-containing protein RICESLEEPER 2-like [Neltuma alba]|uniref:zinc finger BED domain-containing protein RICESLEEPER 2-like n=1 Tax=Neltuma alba TaxID=207710 RepID=UPI0010A48129|nr:zinc finger BED domain-containing protein RICESLEEPER 2-like [Prosopis alba]
MNDIEPRFQVPSRMTAARDYYKLYIEEAGKLRSYFKKAKKRLLNFSVVENHKGDTIAKEIEKCLLSWNIDKVFTIIVDNASSNDSALSTLKADMHYSIDAIRNAIKYVRSSPSRFRKFKELVEKMKIDSKNLLSMDCPTRWNSTYIMLGNAIKFGSVFDRIEQIDVEYKKLFLEKSLVGPPNTADFQVAREFVVFLKVFYNVTLKFSRSLYVTSNIAFQQIVNVAAILNRRANNQSSLLSSMAKSMQIKYDKYRGKFDNFNHLLVIAVVLDPTYKMKILKFAFVNMYNDSTHHEDMRKKVSDVLYCLYDHYSSVLGTSQAEIQTETQSQVASSSITDLNTVEFLDMDGYDGFTTMERFLAQTKIELQTDEYAEVEKYLQVELVEARDPAFDILGWWKVNASRYRVLSLITSDMLVMPISTVSSESAFSTGGRVIDDFRSSLSPKMVEALICAQNWLSPSTSKLKGLDTDDFNDTDDVIHDEEVASNLIDQEQEPKK